jgi:hypothetical protein
LRFICVHTEVILAILVCYQVGSHRHSIVLEFESTRRLMKGKSTLYDICVPIGIGPCLTEEEEMRPMA